MKFNLKKIGLGLIALVLIVIIGLNIWVNQNTRTAKDVALAALTDTTLVDVTEGDWIVFEPTTTEAKIGLIFYTGGLVEPAAYAPALKQITETGVLVVAPSMPMNLAIYNSNAANAIIAEYPQIEAWYIAGHSLGGTSAAIYAEDHPENITGLALWAAYPANSTDLSDNELAVLSIFGSQDGLTSAEEIEAAKNLLPSDTEYSEIDGGNHAQFGDYGLQTRDGTATISMAEQHTQIANLMIEFISP